MYTINPEFPRTDVVIVLGANDVVNPDAKTDSSSPLYGMPVLEVDQARQVFVVKRSLGAGYAGIKNALFELPQTAMVFGDAKAVLNGLLTELRSMGIGKKYGAGCSLLKSIIENGKSFDVPVVLIGAFEYIV